MGGSDKYLVAGLGTGICWYRKVFASPELVVAGICWCRKVVAGPGPVYLSGLRNKLLLSYSHDKEFTKTAIISISSNAIKF